MPVQEVSESSVFRKHLIQCQKSGQLIVVDYYATWCGPCKAVAPAIEQLSNKMPHILFLKVDVDKHQDLTREAGVTAMPTFGFWLEGKLVDTVKGADARGVEERCNKYGKQPKSSFSGQGYSLSGSSSSSSQSTSQPSTQQSSSQPARRNPWADPNFFPGGKKPTASSPPAASSSTPAAKPAAQSTKPVTTATPAVAPAKPAAAQPTPQPTAPAAQTAAQTAAQSTTPSSTPSTNQSGRVHPPELKVDDVMLAELLSMGFTQVRAEKSLILTSNKSTDAALEWLMEHQEDADIDEVLQVVGSKPAGPNLDDMDEDERLIYEQMIKKKAASSSSSGSASAPTVVTKSGNPDMSNWSHAEKMAWLEKKKAEVKAKNEQAALDKLKNDFKSQKGMTSALNDLKEQREEAERKAAMERKKKEAADKAKQRADIAARLAADKERRRIEQQQRMEALQRAKESKQ